MAGSIATGWFTRSAGRRQADAARHSGDRQADAVLDTVRVTLEEQRRIRIEDRRRNAYSEFLMAAQTTAFADRDGRVDLALLPSAFAQVEIEGPAVVTAAALVLFDAARQLGRRAGDEDAISAFTASRSDYIDIVRHALNSAA
ncbi:hypothetical protein ACIGO7_11890 [Streptomyces virginiae]|uniref:hypothetical protein n=1 Tax=Streptomyces virginiae TaxID=1961 RepID=UPI00345029E9